jgi:hypothetical protein
MWLSGNESLAVRARLGGAIFTGTGRSLGSRVTSGKESISCCQSLAGVASVPRNPLHIMWNTKMRCSAKCLAICLYNALRSFMTTAVPQPTTVSRRIADIHDRYVSREKTTLLARPEERVRRILQNLQFAVVPLGGDSCDSQNRTSIYCLRP